MKKLVFTLFVASLVLVSCKEGKKVSATTSKDVETHTSENTSVYKTIREVSRLDWSATHLGGLNERFGSVKLKSAEIGVDKETIQNAVFELDLSSISVESIEDSEQKSDLTKHLKSADFFNIEAHPTSKFELTSIEKATGKFNSKITGNLTILGVSKSITFNANTTISDHEVSIVSEGFSVDRQDWGLSYHSEGEVGVPKDYLISDAVGFKFNVVVTK